MARTVDASAQEPDDDIYDVWVEQKPVKPAKPVHASDTSQERVDETAKSEHEFECPRCGHCCKPDWVGLTDEEIHKFMPYCHTDQDLSDFRTFAFEIEAKLKEKNT